MARFVRRARHALGRRLRVVIGYVRLARRLGIKHALRRWKNDRRYALQRSARLASVTRTIWIEAAAAVGAGIEEISPNVFEFRLGGAVTRVLGQRTPLSTPASTERASDKPLARRLLREAGLPTPKGIVIGAGDVEHAQRFLTATSGPCVVKPARGSGGRGVVGSVRSPRQVRQAVRHVSESSDEIVVERQMDGDHYRLLVLDGELLDVVRRVKPHVTGDGLATVEELIFREYERRLETYGPAGLKPFAADLDCLFTLELQSLGLRSVLPAGVVATVMTATNFGGSADSEHFGGDVAPALAAEARRACEVLGTRLGGVDIIATRADAALAESGGVILEVNAVPGLTHHYAVADPASATHVAIPILRTLLSDSATHVRAEAPQAR